MLVENKTEWRTDDLKAFALGAVRAAGASDKIRVRFAYARRGAHGCGGRAYIGRDGRQGWWMQLNVPSPAAAGADELADEALRDLAAVADHEVAHLLGVEHADMADAVRWCVHDPAWRAGLRVRRRAAKKKPSAVEARAEKAARMAETWRRTLAQREAAVKRARRTLAKWEAKVRRYRRNGVLPPE